MASNIPVWKMLKSANPLMVQQGMINAQNLEANQEAVGDDFVNRMNAQSHMPGARAPQVAPQPLAKSPLRGIGGMPQVQLPADVKIAAPRVASTPIRPQLSNLLNMGGGDVALRAISNDAQRRLSMPAGKGSKEMLNYSPGEYQALQDVLTNTKAYQAERGGVDKQREILASLAAAVPKSQADYASVLGGLANYETGGKFKGPAAQEDNTLQYAALVQNVAKAQQDRESALNELPFKYLKSTQSGINQIGDGGGISPTLAKEVERHQKRMEGMQGVVDTFMQLDAAIGGIDNWKEGKDIPGVGATGSFPSVLLSKEGSNIQQIYSDLKNQLIYMRSGKQINEAEYRRLSTALGSGLLSGDREFINALKRFSPLLKATMQQKEAAVRAVHPQVIDLYREGGGQGSEDYSFPGELKPVGPVTDKKPEIRKAPLSREAWAKAKAEGRL